MDDQDARATEALYHQLVDRLDGVEVDEIHRQVTARLHDIGEDGARRHHGDRRADIFEYRGFAEAGLDVHLMAVIGKAEIGGPAVVVLAADKRIQLLAGTRLEYFETGNQPEYREV